MEVFFNTKFVKRIIIVLVFLILFDFCYPLISKAETHILAGDPIETEAGTYHYTAAKQDATSGILNFPTWDTIGYWIANIILNIEVSVYGLINNIFCDKNHKYAYKAKIRDNSFIYRVEMPFNPESIIKGKFLLFNANIFQHIPEDDESYEDRYYDYAKRGITSGRNSLRDTISGWYYSLRNFAIIALLSVLVYVGIRMILSTVSQDKAKYKIMFKDWFVALCLVILMHFIMIGILKITDTIIENIGTEGGASISESILKRLAVLSVAENSYEVDHDEDYYAHVRVVFIEEQDGTKEVSEFLTTGDMFSYMLVLLVIIIFSIIFAVKYLKREFTIIFLILLGPLSCITYPIDKISDGKAQAYNKWFSEFLYQVIIQPFHLILYLVLVGSATQLATVNILYSIICFAIMIPAEKFIKEMFGFKNKLGSPLGAFAGGAVASQVFSKMKSSSSSAISKGEKDSKTTELPAKVKQKELPGQKTENNTINKGLPGSKTENVKEKGLIGPKSADDNKGVLGLKPGQDKELQNSKEETQVDSKKENNTDSASERIDKAQENKETNRVLEEAIDSNREKEREAETDTSTHTKEVEPKLDGDNGEDGTDGSDGTVNTKEVDSLEDGNNGEDGTDGDNGTVNINSKEPGEENDNDSNEGNIEENQINPTDDGHFRNIYNQRLMNKYGTTKKSAVFGKRAGRVGKYIGKKAGKLIKGATTLGASALIGTVGFMTGNGAKGFVVGAAAGSMIGNKVGNLEGRAAGKISELNNAYSRKKPQEEFNKKHQIAARDSFIEREGYVPDGNQLANELNKMYELNQMGVKDDYLEDAMSQYHNNLSSGMEEKDAIGFAAMGAIEASTYSRKDFLDEKMMKDRIETLKGKYIAAGYSDQQANEYARMIMKNGASIKGVNNPALPETNTTIDVPLYQELGLGKNLGIEDSNLETKQMERLNNITLRLHDQGYSNDEIQRVAQLSQGIGIPEEEIIETFAINTEYLLSNKTADYSRGVIGSGATKEQIRTENLERLEVKYLGRSLDDNQISKQRKEEIGAERITVKTAREYAKSANSREIATRNDNMRIESKNELREKLIQSGLSGVAAEKQLESFDKLSDRAIGIPKNESATRTGKQVQNRTQTKTPKQEPKKVIKSTQTKEETGAKENN